MISRYFVGFGLKKRDYVINGIRYSVTSRFMPPENKTTLTDKVKNYLDSDFADLTNTINSNTLTNDYVCSTVRKED